MYKKPIFLAVLALGLVPHLVSAAWWNPLDWFKKTQPATVVQPLIEDSEPTITEPVLNEADAPQIVEKIVEKPVTKTVTQTVTVDNPELQTKIDALLAQNKALNEKIISLTGKYNGCIADLKENSSSAISAAQAEAIETTETADAERKAKINALIVKIAEIETETTKYQSGAYCNGLGLDACRRQANAKVRELEIQKADLQLELTKLNLQ